MPVDAPVRLIVNPAAGGGRAAGLVAPVEAELARLGLEVTSARTTSIEHARELAVEAHRSGAIPVTLSGDGLVGCVAGALAALGEPEPPLMGVIPGGRGNDFARMVEIPFDAVAACALIASGVPRPIDLGTVDGAPFVGIASLGFDSDANRIANEGPARLGSLVYAYAALRALVTYRHARFTVEIDGQAERTFAGWSVAAANASTYGGGMIMAPEARLDDGLLEIVLSASTSRARFLMTLPKIFKGEHVDEPSVTVLRGAEVRVRADRPFVVYADGDPIGALPATIGVLPAAVRVLLPR